MFFFFNFILLLLFNSILLSHKQKIIFNNRYQKKIDKYISFNKKKIKYKRILSLIFLYIKNLLVCLVNKFELSRGKF
jgi:hypothetical protein